ncbi:MAG: OmpH family outer membrane protein [Alistipes sp.]|nr:OmpH family outer membrane protein [Alistipes sp.]
MKNVLKLTLALAMMLGVSSLYAQKLGRIDTNDIIVSMPEMKELQTNMEAFAKDLNDNLETIQVEFNTKFQDYQKNMNTLSDAVRQIKEKELQDLRQRIIEYQQMAQQEIQKKEQELSAPIMEKAKAAIDAVSKAGGYLAVFETGSMIYFDAVNMTDITPLVKKELGITATAN